MNPIRISSVTSEKLKARAYIDSFPEYYELASVTENSLWHNHQNVLDHVIGVFAGLETLLQFGDLADTQKKVLNNYLQEVVGNQNRQNILKVATLLHDIAKTDVLVTKPDGTAGCPGHELIAAARVKNFAHRFDLDSRAESNVERIVRYHGFISEILNVMIANQDKEKYYRILIETVGDIAIELILLMHADLLGSDLISGNRKGYDDRIELLAWMLQTQITEIEQGH